MGIKNQDDANKMWLRFLVDYLRTSESEQKLRLRKKITKGIHLVVPTSVDYYKYNRGVTKFLKRLNRLEHFAWAQLLDALLDIEDTVYFTKAKKLSPFRLIGLARTDYEQNMLEYWSKPKNWPELDRGDQHLLLAEIFKDPEAKNLHSKRPILFGFQSVYCRECKQNLYEIMFYSQSFDGAESDDGILLKSCML